MNPLVDAPQLHGAVRELYDVLVDNARLQRDGRHVVMFGSASLAAQTGKTTATVTKQLGVLRDHGLVVGDGRRSIEVVVQQSRHAPVIPGAVDNHEGDQRANTIMVLADMVRDFPALRCGLAHAIAIVATEGAVSRDRSRLVAIPDIEEEEGEEKEASSPGDLPSEIPLRPRLERDGRDSAATLSCDEVTALVRPLISEERRRRRNLSVALTQKTAGELQWLTAEQLAAGMERAGVLMRAGRIESAIAVLVTRGRSRDEEFFAPAEVVESPPEHRPRPWVDAEEQEVDPHAETVERFAKLAPGERQCWIDTVAANSTVTQRQLFGFVPAAQERMAAELWAAQTDTDTTPDDAPALPATIGSEPR